MREFNATPHSAPSGSLPTSVFVGREEQLAIFRRYLQAERHERVRVLVFHGMAGYGKSMLLRALRSSLQEQSPPVPHAWFNLRNLNDRPQAYREVLASWRSQMQDRFGLRFSRFDVCLALILAREGDEQSPLLSANPSLAPTYALAQRLLESSPQSPENFNSGAEAAGLSSALGFWLAKGDDSLPAIQSLCQRVEEDDPTVAVELVDYFAMDLCESLWDRTGKAVGGVLFLDSYEALWPGERILLPQFAHHVDWWLRELAAFFLMQGVLLVIGANEPLRWAETDADWTGDDIEQKPIGGLTPAQAQEFLARCGIGPSHPEAPSSLQRAIIRSSSPGASGGLLNQWTNRQLGESSPLWLALSADTVQNLRMSGKADPGAASFALVSSGEPGKKLCDHFLKSFSDSQTADWLCEVALTPRNDEAACPALSSPGTQNQQPNWGRFTQLSCVEPQDDSFWRIKTQVRRDLMAQLRRDDASAAHLNFTHHWAQRAEPALMWFHKWALDPAGSLDEWAKQHAAALQAGELAHAALSGARVLLSWWSEISLDEQELERVDTKTWARAHSTIARALLDTPYLSCGPALAFAMAHFESALSVYTSDEFPREWAETQIQIGRAQRALAGECATQEAKDAYLKAALERYRAALAIATPHGRPREWAEIQMEMGAAHRDLMLLHEHGSGPRDYAAQAVACYEQAIRLYSEAKHPRQWAHIQKEIGETYAASHVGGRIRNLERAIASFKNGLKVFSEAEMPREWAALLCALGNVLLEHQGGERTENLREALSCYLAALRVYNEQQTPAQWAETNLQAGLAWGELAYLNEERNAFRSAVNYVSTAARGFEQIGRPREAAKATDLANEIAEALQRTP